MAVIIQQRSGRCDDAGYQYVDRVQVSPLPGGQTIGERGHDSTQAPEY